jgi:hypothetical protein
MLDWLDRLMRALLARRRREPESPYDPYSPVRAPRRDAPGGRTASAAVVEPFDDERVVATGVRSGGRGAARPATTAR